ncbi:MAG: SRPBCC family protein [Chloroflexi bacterium]|nr:SRPBCC family protein [Chloroflexota bacterium]
MRLFEHTAMMPYAVEDVFNLTVDLEKAPHWHSIFTTVKQLTPAPIGSGSRWQIKFRGGGFTLEIINYQPPHRVEFVGSSIMGVIPNFTIEFESIAEGTRVRYLLHPDVPALIRPVAALIAPPYGRHDLNRYFRELDVILAGD